MAVSLIVSETKNQARPMLYSTRTETWSEFNLPPLQNRLIWGSGLGYLVVYDKIDRLVMLVDPSSEVIIELPDLGDLLNGITEDNAEQWIVRAILLRVESILNVFLVYHTTAVRGEDMAVIEHAKSYCVTRVELVEGDHEWVNVAHYLEETPFWHEFIFFRGKLYGCTQHGELFRIRPNSVFLKALTPLKVNFALLHRSYLVDVQGVLTMVIRVFEELLRPDVDVDDLFGFEGTNFYHITEKIILYQFKNRAWTKVNDIGTSALFVGRNTSFCVDCTTDEGAHLFPNSVYYTDEFSEGVDLGCYLVGQSKFLRDELPFWNNLPENLVFSNYPVWTTLSVAAPQGSDTETEEEVAEEINVHPRPSASSSAPNENSSAHDNVQSTNEASASNSNVHVGHPKGVKSGGKQTTIKSFLSGESSHKAPQFLYSHNKSDLSSETIFPNAITLAGTTVDTFLIENPSEDAADEDVYDVLKTVLYTESAAVSEGAGMIMGILTCGTESEKVTKISAYANETWHENVIRLVQQKGGLVLVLYTESAAGGGAAGMITGLLTCGTESEKVTNISPYADETWHGTVIRLVQQKGGLVLYHRRKLENIILDKHEKAMSKIGTILATGIIGINCDYQVPNPKFLSHVQLPMVILSFSVKAKARAKKETEHKVLVEKAAGDKSSSTRKKHIIY